MAITNTDGLIASAKQNIRWTKTGARTTIAAAWFSLFDIAGEPGAGTLAGSSTAAGVVPDDTTTGTPGINAFGGGATGYLTLVQFSSTVAGRIAIADMLFKAGAYAFNAATTLAAQPSYSARVPSGTDYSGTSIWIECVTAFTGNLSVAVTYTNQAGVAAHTTGTFATGTALTVGRMMQLPLQAGDTGVQKIESVTATVASAGTFNVLVLRQLWTDRVRSVNDGGVDDPFKTGMPVVFATSALIAYVANDSTASGVPDLLMQVANG
jgi:hypothetical protein